MTKKVSDRNTKAELLEAYQELAQEKNDLETQIKQLSSTPKEVKPISEEKTKPMTPTPVVQKPKMQQTIDHLLLLQTGFGSAINELSEQLTSEAIKLGELRQNVTQELQQLAELHDLETVEDDTLDTLVQRYETSAKTFDQELSLRRETLEQEFQEQQKAWQKEQEEYQRTIKERNETYKKSRSRDQETYNYNLELQRNIDSDTYSQTQKTLYKQLEDLQKEQEKQWSEREKTIAEREKLYAEVKAKVAEFPQKLEDNIKRGKDLGRNIGNYQAKIKSDLLAKEVEGQKQYYELRVKSLIETIQSQDTRLQTLSKQLDSALKQVQDLAVKAIEGASNVSSFQAVKEIALEQAKNPNKGK
ncbi:conserved hypothetical protein [Planktothrix sp. PCC 11201]|uniref:hypothetical protein n=1 Tax=Planktothrix sp. PCC 11201 TaxID=1729650 RepID=UPI00091AC7C1|nr:hypothetical protein [Planktothrix sp. PCC 11201]SKB13271.1 conserved hypothetical protein [Planktothrix sp. PCC 11201]